VWLQIGALMLETFMHILDPPGGLQPESILAELNSELCAQLHLDAKYNNKGQVCADLSHAHTRVRTLASSGPPPPVPSVRIAHTRTLHTFTRAPTYLSALSLGMNALACVALR
jgi:hypothetical protein